MSPKTRISIIVLSVFLPLIAGLSIAAYHNLQKKSFAITDVKMALGVNEKFMPVDIKESFPEGTAQVYCWFSWKNAKLNMPITAGWDYTTDEIHILDYTFNIPRKKGSGSVSLTMPKGKELPLGDYQVKLSLGRRVIKSLNFKVE